MALSKKLRFDVLSRDNHCCMYCWRKPPYVMLEVDHIIPKKKWWSDILDNLITSCFDCNRWKWWETKQENNWKLYKKKIDNMKIKIKDYLYNERNKKYMWTISKDTYILLRFYIDTLVSEDEIKRNILIDNHLKDKSNDYSLFMISDDYCDEMLSWAYMSWCEQMDNTIQYVYDEERRTIDNDYWFKLNYVLTEELLWLYERKDYYILRRFTQHKYLIEE